MKDADYGSKEMLAFFEIYPDNVSLPTLITRRNLVRDQKVSLEELASNGLLVTSLLDLGEVIEKLDDAIGHRLIGSEDSLIYDIKENKVYLNRKGKLSSVNLTLPECAVLKYLMQHTGEQGLRSIAEGAGLINSEHIPFLIRNIRRKLGDSAKNPRYIETARGIGYRFVGQVSATVQSGNAIYNVPTPQ